MDQMGPELGRDDRAVAALRAVRPPRAAPGGLAGADRQDERTAQGRLRLDGRGRGADDAHLLVFADADSSAPTHIVEFYGLLGGGLRDAGWDGSGRPTARLAILPGTTHYDISPPPRWRPRSSASSTQRELAQRQPSVSGSAATTTVPRPGGLTQRQRPARRLGAVAQAEDAGPARRVGAAAAVVGDLAAQDAAIAADRDARAARPPRAWRRWSAPRRRCSTPSPRCARAARSSAASMSTGIGSRSASASSALRRPRSPRIAGCRPRAISRSSCEAGVELARGVVEQVGRGLGVRGQPRPRQAQLEHDGDEALLRAVVQVALEPAPLLVAGLDQARARGDQVGARLRAGDGQRGELAERAEAVLGVRRQRVLAGDRDRAPQRAGDDDRGGGGRAVAGAEDRLGDLARRARPSRRSAPARRSSARARRPSARSAGRRSPTWKSSMLSRLWRPTIVAVPSPS